MRGLTHAESLDRILKKMIRSRDPLDSNTSTRGSDFDLELINKVRKQSGMNHEEAVKTLQLKRELDRILEQKLHQESGGSSEDSSDQQHCDYALSPTTKERMKAERKF